jgi:quinol monooxygenase YgiN
MKLIEACFVLTVGICIGYTIIPLFATKKTRKTVNKGAFFLGITIKFNTEEDKKVFSSIFGPYAQFVAKSEMGTISYELSESDKSPLQIYLVERYISKEAYLDVHRKTDEFIKFRAKLTELSTTMVMDGHSYIESNLGFI